MGERDTFFSRCSEVRETAFSYSNPLIINHFDCDGLTSGAIVKIALEEKGKKPKVMTVKKLDESVLAEAKAHKGEVIFVDLAGACKEVDEIKDVIILDHHQTEGGKTLQINPHLFGFDGGDEISSSGVAYFTFRIRVDLGVVGAVGDMQYPLIGLNREMLQEGVQKGEVENKTDIRLYGRGSRPLQQMLEYADEPYLPGLTANAESCRAFLESLCLSQDTASASYYELSEEEKKKFINALVSHLAERGQEKTAKHLVGEVYVFPKNDKRTELYDASEFSTLLNACGRNGKAELGIAVCTGEFGAYAQASSLLETHRKNLREGMKFLSQNLQDFGKFYFLDARGAIADGIVGVVAGMGLTSTAKKPIFAIAADEHGAIKVSSRANAALVKAGLNLGMVLKAACEKCGGAGGGHRIAAGATLPKGQLDRFLGELNKLL